MNDYITNLKQELNNANQWLRDHNDYGQMDTENDPIQTMSFMRGKVVGLIIAIERYYKYLHD